MSKFSLMFNMPFVVTNSGRTLRLDALAQRRTYLGGSGFPLPDVNQTMLKWALHDASKWKQQPVFLIKPVIIDYTHELDERELQGVDDQPHERLPMITCMADLSSGQIEGSDGYCSSLTVLWFQDSLAMPLDPAVEEKLKAIDWDKHAANYDPD